MKLKNKLRKRLLPITSNENLKIGDELIYNNIKIGKILINDPLPFGLIKILDPDIEEFKNKELLANNKKCKILKALISLERDAKIP